MAQREKTTRQDLRRAVPRTDSVLADTRLVPALSRLGPAIVKGAVVTAQQRVRGGEIEPDDLVASVLAALPDRATSLRPVINATGVVLHTNLGRASLSTAAIEALVAASSYVDVEFDIADGKRAARGRDTLKALRTAVPAAQDALVVNNGAAALVLATTALATGREVIVSRGEMVEIGDGFRLPDLIASTGAIVREVGTTNRTYLRDYEAVTGPQAGCILKVHPSNFRIEGFAASVSVKDLVRLNVPVIVDVGSGLLHPDRTMPDEPDVTGALDAGATLVTCSGDKLLGGPQSGLIFGDREVIQSLRRHPLARALRVDKLTLAALEATLTGPATPTFRYLHADPATQRRRCEAIASAVGAEVTASNGAVGGGGAPGLAQPGWAVSLPAHFAASLRQGEPCIVGRLEQARCLLDLRCVPESEDSLVIGAILRITA